MRIAFATPEYVTEPEFDGGLASYLHRAALSLVKMGHEPVIFVAAQENERFNHRGVEVRRVAKRHAGVRVLNRLTGRRFRKSFQWIEQSWNLRRAIQEAHREEPIHIVQYASYMATGLFRARSIPSVVRISSFEPLWQTAYERRTEGWDERLIVKLEELSLRRADGLYGPSRLLADLVGKALDRPVCVIEPPFHIVADEEDESARLDSLAGRQYLLFFGSIGLLKGAGLIAGIIGEILDRHRDLCFAFVGKDQGFRGQPMMEHIRRQAGPFRDRVRHLGRLEWNKLHPVIRGAYAVVLPSRIDNLPNTCLEAMALGKVVIGSRGGSFEELIEEEVSGFLVDNDDGADLLGTLEEVLQLDDGRIRQIGEAARKKIEEMHPESVMPKLLSFYREHINGRGQRSEIDGMDRNIQKKTTA
ncbi:MAG TPA: glycosyltransferase family 4 protein [Syntrophales bacterium]|nr:glycosyltransferase family 4 protein [Syntrophales bacterium]